MSVAIAIYVTGAVAWFGGMGMEADIDALHKSDKNPFNNESRRMQAMMVVSLVWPVFLALTIPSVIYNWATSIRHERKAKQ